MSRAAVCESVETGAVRVQDWDLKKPGPGEVLVSTRAAGINFGELLQLKGQYQEKLAPPFVPGNEMSGVVSAVGDNVTVLKPGDPVVGLPRGGAWASQVVLPQQAVIPLGGPRDGESEVDFAGAAALSVAYGTAYLALKNRARMVGGETVLVTAAAGGVGLAAIEVAKHLGAGRIIAAAGDKAKADLAVERGADVGIVYEKDEDPRSFRENKLKSSLGKGGIDIIVDMVGGPLLEPMIRSLNFDGRCLVVGFASGNIPKIPANILLVKNIDIVGVYWGAHAIHRPQLFQKSSAEVVDLWRRKVLNPHIGATFPLDQVDAAVAAVRARKTTGKVILLPSN